MSIPGCPSTCACDSCLRDRVALEFAVVKFCGGKGSRRPGPCPTGRHRAHHVTRAYANAAAHRAGITGRALERARAAHAKHTPGTKREVQAHTRVAAAALVHEAAQGKADRLHRKARALEHQHATQERVKAAAKAKRAAGKKKPQKKPASPNATPEEGSNERGQKSGEASKPVAEPPAEAGKPVAQEAGGSSGSAASASGNDAGKPAGKGTAGAVPASKDEVNKRLDRFGKLFRSRGQHQVADWMDKLRDHVNTVGTDAALAALGTEVKGGGEKVQYGGWSDIGEFAEHYLDRNGITLVHGGATDPNAKIVSTTAPSSDAEGVHSRGKATDAFPTLPKLKDKLDEARHLPGLETSEDLGKIMGGKAGEPVKKITPEVTSKLDEKYGKDGWIVKPYSDEAYAGYGIFFPQRVRQIQQDAKSAIWSSGQELSKYGFSHLRDDSGKVVGIKHKGGDEYKFGTDKYDKTINGDVRQSADRAAAAAPNEHGAALPEGSFMAQPAFAAAGVNDADRAAGKTIAPGEGRVHITTRGGKAEVIPHSTWIKGEHLPVVFESDDTRAMAKSALDAINALPESERQGQLYAPDILKARDGYKVVEANPANEAGASGYLQDNPFVIDSYVSHLTGREPAHVHFVRKLLSGKRARGTVAQHAEFSEGGHSLRNVKIFYRGQHKGQDYDRSDLDDLVRNFKRYSAPSVKPGKGRPILRNPVVMGPEVSAAVGHEEKPSFLDRTDEPARGWISDVWHDGHNVFCDIDHLADEDARLIEAHRYKTLSPEIYPKPPPGIPGKGIMLRRVSFMGGQIAELKRLGDLPMPVKNSERFDSYRPALLQFREAIGCADGRCWVTIFNEVRDMTRDEKVAKLTAMSADADCLKDLPDAALDEWLRMGDSWTADLTRIQAEADAAKQVADAQDKAREDAAAAMDPDETEDPDESEEFDEDEDPEEFDEPEEEPVSATATRTEKADKTALKYSEQVIQKLVAAELAKAVAGLQSEAKKSLDANLAVAAKFNEDLLASKKIEIIDNVKEASLREGFTVPAEWDRTSPDNHYDALLRADNMRVVVAQFAEADGTKHDLTAFALEVRRINKRKVISFGEKVRDPYTQKTTEDAEVGKVEAHWERFSETFEAAGCTKENLVQTFKIQRKTDKNLSADGFLKVK